jgi:hypothetical protein
MILLLVVLVAIGVLGADRLVDPVEPSVVAQPAAHGEPAAGTWVCPVGDDRDGTVLSATVARPPSSTQTPSEVEVGSIADGERSAVAASRLFTGSSSIYAPGGGPESAAVVDWRDGPAVVQRQWTLTGEGEQLPTGIVAGGCVEPFSDRWFVPGMDTSGGAQAVLRMANPFPTDATIAVGFVAPEGPLQPLALRNLSVEGRGTLEIDVNEYLPERPDLAAVVTVASGRIGVQGYQLVRSAIGGVNGVSPLDAAPEASETWTIPWIVDGDDLASWLWVYNPGERQALVELTYHTPDGGIVPEGLADVAVDPGQLRRVDLRGTLPEDRTVVGLSTRSDGAPVVVSGATQLRSDDAARSGFAVQLGVPEADTSWTVSGGSMSGRTEQLHLNNPAGVDATVSVSLFTGVTIRRPDGLQDVTVAAGSQRVIDLAPELGDVEAWTAFVTASSGEVVVGRVGSGNAEQRNLVAVPGIPSSAWTTTGSGLTPVYDDGLVTRFATSRGIEREPQLPDLPDESPEDPVLPEDGGAEETPVPPPAPDDTGTDTDEPAPGAPDPDAPDPDAPDAPDPDAPQDAEDSEDNGAVGARLDEDLFGRTVDASGDDGEDQAQATDEAADTGTDDAAVEAPAEG